MQLFMFPFAENGSLGIFNRHISLEKILVSFETILKAAVFSIGGSPKVKQKHILTPFVVYIAKNVNVMSSEGGCC